MHRCFTAMLKNSGAYRMRVGRIDIVLVSIVKINILQR